MQTTTAGVVLIQPKQRFSVPRRHQLIGSNACQAHGAQCAVAKDAQEGFVRITKAFNPSGFPIRLCT
jgi:hypothetical protein